MTDNLESCGKIPYKLWKNEEPVPYDMVTDYVDVLDRMYLLENPLKFRESLIIHSAADEECIPSQGQRPRHLHDIVGALTAGMSPRKGPMIAEISG